MDATGATCLLNLRWVDDDYDDDDDDNGDDDEDNSDDDDDEHDEDDDDDSDDNVDDDDVDDNNVDGDDNDSDNNVMMIDKTSSLSTPLTFPRCPALPYRLPRLASACHCNKGDDKFIVVNQCAKHTGCDN